MRRSNAQRIFLVFDVAFYKVMPARVQVYCTPRALTVHSLAADAVHEQRQQPQNGEN